MTYAQKGNTPLSMPKIWIGLYALVYVVPYMYSSMSAWRNLFKQLLSCECKLVFYLTLVRYNHGHSTKPDAVRLKIRATQIKSKASLFPPSSPDPSLNSNICRVQTQLFSSMCVSCRNRKIQKRSLLLLESSHVLFPPSEWGRWRRFATRIQF